MWVPVLRVSLPPTPPLHLPHPGPERPCCVGARAACQPGAGGVDEPAAAPARQPRNREPQRRPDEAGWARARASPNPSPNPRPNPSPNPSPSPSPNPTPNQGCGGAAPPISSPISRPHLAHISPTSPRPGLRRSGASELLAEYELVRTDGKVLRARDIVREPMMLHEQISVLKIKVP